MIITYNIFETTRKSNECFDYNVHAFPTEKDRVIGSPFKISLGLRPRKNIDLGEETVSVKSWEIINLNNGESIYVNPERLDVVVNKARSIISVHSYYLDMEYTDHVVNVELDASFCNPPKNNLSLELKFLQKEEKLTFWDVLMGV